MLNDEIAKAVKDAIDTFIEDNQEDGRRDHLGASMIGRECSREIWYSWRWAVNRKHDARMLRLFNRGHREEDRFVEWLQGVCDEVWALDPRTGNQIRIADFKGYFGGSLDGVVRNPAGYQGDYLVEFKTHGDKSYTKLLKEGVADAKPEHYTQMQTYLHYKPKLLGALYFAINKNDDNLYVEFVRRDEKHAQEALTKTQNILLSSEPPARFAEASEYNFYCNRFCDYSAQCWKNIAPDMSCRTCEFVQPTDDGWLCKKTELILSSDEQRIGCKQYERGF